ncbi:TfuA-like protein [Kitasatospora sp. NPDC101155]|uniref:TfuA-like protein n=1 Tax=Kitasatospora sp. NPDC101155 TaxID=3364097 RepID=UPI0037FB8811
MSASRVVVYTGPTLSAAEVHAVLPDAEVRPPAGRGDLLADHWSPGDVAVIIDGYFRERRSVGHKEILQVITEGAHVLGAASMGALRAAELAPCGMRGIGTVYEMYASGEIDGDDEVGVLHGPAAVGYPAQTVALVNLRHGCREGAETDLVPEAAGRRIVAAAKALPFTHRGWKDLERAVGEEDHDALRTLEEMIGSGFWDLKRNDAVSALRAIRSGGTTAPGPAATEVPVTGISRTQALARRTRREHAPGRWMSDLDVLDAVRLFEDDYPGLHEEVLSALLDDLARAEGATTEAYARARLGLDDHAPLPPALTRWFTAAEVDGLTAANRNRLLMVRVWPVWQSVDWRPAALARLRADERWDEWCDLVARADAAAEEARHRLIVPPPAMCARLFLRHWRRPGTSSEVETARRGFSGPDELGHAVRRFFAYDVRRAREEAATR